MKTGILIRRGIWIVLLLCLVWAVFSVAIHTILENNTLGIDFATFWIGSRTILLDGKTPYSENVTQISQQLIYKRPALPDEDQLAFAYPLPSVFLLAPVVWMSLDWAEAFWMGLNIIALLTALFFLFPKSPGWIRFTFLLFYPVVFGLILGNFAILICVFILVFLQTIVNKNGSPSRKSQILSGILMAICLIKPQFVWGYVLLAVLVTWRYHLRTFISSMAISSIGLLIASILLLPTWPLEWLNRVSEYAHYVKAQSAISIYLKYIFPDAYIYPLSMIVMIVVISISVLLIIKWWKNKLDSLLLIAWCGFVIYLVHPHGISYEQITFLIPFLIWAGNTRKNQLTTSIIWLVSILISWGLFFVTFFKLIPPAVNEYSFIFYIIWMSWFFWTSWNKPSRKSDLKI